MHGEEKAKLPPLVPRLVSFFRAATFLANPIPVLSDNLSKYGSTYRFHIGGLKKGIVSVEPEVIQHVLQKNNRNYRKSEIQTVTLAHYVGQGLLTSEGEYWLRQRRLIQPGFHQQRLRKLVDLINVEIAACISSLKEVAKRQGVIDLYQTMHKLAFRIVAKTLFSTGLEENLLEKLSNQITDIQKFIVKQIRQPYARLWHQWSGQTHACEETARETREILTKIIQDRTKAGTRHDDLLQMLLDTRYEDTGEAMNMQQVLDECLILFVAGHETSANALTWTFYLLSKNPEKIKPILAESCRMTNAQPSFDQLSHLCYTTQVIEESLRLYPPAWIIDRVAINDDCVAGYRIPKDTMIILFIYGSHHYSLFWQDPENFRPERFGPEERKTIPAFAYFPFGGGPRKCIGNNFAMMEMQLVLTQMVKAFQFECLSDQVTLLPLITLRPQEKLLFKLKERS
jgi:cytochrome P450